MEIDRPLTAPELHQAEVTLIGPGFGESTLVHLGNNYWVIIDSCIDNSTGEAAALSYLEAIGVKPAEAVKLVIATHWHDDHIRGLYDIVETCKNAEFCCSSAYSDTEFINFIAAYNGNNPIAGTSGAQELYKIVQNKKSAKKAISDRLLKKFCASEVGNDCEVWSLSPSDEEVNNSLSNLGPLMPKVGESKRRASPTNPNNSSVVIYIKIANTAILLGADLENRTGNRGWSVIVDSAQRPTEKASVFKIPHHGSSNGHYDAVWKELLVDETYAILTPFNRTPLPKSADVSRICALTKNAYSSSKLKPKSLPKRPKAIEKTLKESGIKVISSESTTGAIQLRQTASNDWNVNLYNPACRLSEIYK